MTGIWRRSALMLGACVGLATTGQAQTARAQATRAQAAKTQAAKATATKAQTPASPSADTARVERALLAAEETASYAQLNAWRATYLAKSDWADLGDRCNPGHLRVFPRDTTPEQRDSLQALVESMEFAIISGGVGSRLDTPEAQRLLRVIVGWEAGIDRPNWDVPASAARQPMRQAVATGLTGEVPDPQGPGCLPSPIANDTVTVVVPGFTTMEFPKSPKTRIKAYFGPEAPYRVRDEFFATVGRNAPQAELSYLLVAPVVLWKDYALVAVRRPLEQGGVAVGTSSQGGAVYLMRRIGSGAGAEWRLLSIVRTWGA